MKRTYIIALYFCFSCIGFANASTNNIHSELSATEKLHQLALATYKKRESLKPMKIYEPKRDEYRQYNRQMEQLVELSKNALSGDLQELDATFKAIEDWNMHRRKIAVKPSHSTGGFGGFYVYKRPKNLESRLTMYRLSIQHFLLQQQEKPAEIIELLMGEYKSLKRVPKFYRHHLASAHAKLNNIEESIKTLSLFDFTEEKISKGTIKMLAMAYIESNQAEKALELIESRSNLFGETPDLLELKYGVLMEAGDTEAAIDIQELLALQDIQPRRLARGITSIAWSPILDHI